MKRKLLVVAAIVVLVCGAAYAANFAVRETWWSGSRQDWETVTRWHVNGVLENVGTVHYSYVKISYAIYDRKDDTRIWTQSASTSELAPGERWKFTCKPGFCTSEGRPAKVGYYYKCTAIKVIAKKEQAVR